MTSKTPKRIQDSPEYLKVMLNKAMKELTDTQAKLEEATLLLREIKAHWDRGLDLYQSIWDGVVNFLASLEEGKGDK